MANAATLAQMEPVRMLLVGYPGAGKTGALASLLNMGYKIRLIDFDGNYSPLLKFTKKEFLPNLDIVTFEDKLRNGAQYIDVAGVPNAFANALKIMDRWEYTNPDGTKTDLGASKDWGCDTIVAVDGMTGMGEAAFRRIRNMLNKTPLNTTQQVWGIAMKEQEAFVEKATSTSNKFHFIMLSHLKLVGPKAAPEKADEVAKEIASRNADLVPTRLFPSALGNALPPMIGGHFPTLLLVERQVKMNKIRRIITTNTGVELDTKLPALLDKDTFDIETGLAEIFKAIAPPLDGCVGSNSNVAV